MCPFNKHSYTAQKQLIYNFSTKPIPNDIQATIKGFTCSTGRIDDDLLCCTNMKQYIHNTHANYLQLKLHYLNQAITAMVHQSSTWSSNFNTRLSYRLRARKLTENELNRFHIPLEPALTRKTK